MMTSEISEVQINSVVQGMANDIVKNMLAQNQQAVDDNEVNMQSYTEMFRDAFSKGLNLAIVSYVKTGKWDTSGANNMASYNALLMDIGLNDLSLLPKYKIVQKDRELGVAVVEVEAKQTELEKPFIFKVRLQQTANKRWRLVKVENFSQFFMLLQKRRQQDMLNYINKTENIMAVHRQNFINLDSRIREIINFGDLGNRAVRKQLSDIITNKMLPSWVGFRKELTAVQVPTSANTIQNLRLQICDSYITYYENYAKWLNDNNIQELRLANDSMKKARALEANEINLTNIIKRDLTQPHK